MRSTAIAFFLMCSTAAAQQTTPQSDLIDGINKAIAEGVIDDAKSSPSASVPPDWGIVVKDVTSGKLVDVFGAVPYEVTPTGMVNIPGYVPPEGTSLKLVPQKEYFTVANATVEMDPAFQPLSVIPGAVIDATDYLANELCGRRGRPSGISLSLVVTASGNIFFASVGTEAGSEVSWDFQDVCVRYEMEGEGKTFR